VLYVVDILAISTDNALSQVLIDQLKTFNQVKIQDHVVDFLQMEWIYGENGNSVRQSNYVVESLTSTAPNGSRYAYPMSSGACVRLIKKL
jgi:hypothetical protein